MSAVLNLVTSRSLHRSSYSSEFPANLNVQVQLEQLEQLLSSNNCAVSYISIVYQEPLVQNAFFSKKIHDEKISL